MARFFSATIRGQVYRHRSLAPLTTWKIGGPAEYLVIPHDLDDIFAVFRQAHRHGLPLFFLGRGSNILVADAGVPGVTLYLSPSLKKISLSHDTITVGAGVAMPALASFLARRGKTGFEFLCGIPGSVGGGVRLNAGIGPEQDIKSCLHSVSVITPQCQVRQFPAAELMLRYRSSRLLNFPHWLVVEAEFHPTGEASPEEIKSKIHHLLAIRRAKSPANPKNCGSVFKNPAEGPPAGWLIDQAGLKGMQYGQAQIALEHANYIVNLGNATANHVQALVMQIQDRVWQAHGIALEREVIIWPDDILLG